MYMNPHGRWPWHEGPHEATGTIAAGWEAVARRRAVLGLGERGTRTPVGAGSRSGTAVRPQSSPVTHCLRSALLAFPGKGGVSLSLPASPPCPVSSCRAGEAWHPGTRRASCTEPPLPILQAQLSRRCVCILTCEADVTQERVS